MPFEDFEILIARFGTNPARWPDPSLADRADVKVWLQTERALDAALAPAPLSANFVDRVMAKLPEDVPAKSRKPFLVWAAPIAAALVAGVFLLGPLGNPMQDDLTAEDEAQIEGEWLEVAELAGMTDLYEWVEG